MGVKRSWKINKISSLSLSKEEKEAIINSIIRRKKPKIKIYTLDYFDDIAEIAYPSKVSLVKDWIRESRYITRFLTGTAKNKLRVKYWTLEVKDIIPYINSGAIKNIPIPETCSSETVFLPEHPQTLQNQG